MSVQLSLFDDAPDPPAQAHSATSRAAAGGIAPVAGRLRRRVYEYLVACAARGATDEEMQDALAMPASTQRPRRRELQLAGLIRDGGGTRPTRSGRKAVVWVVTAKQENAA